MNRGKISLSEGHRISRFMFHVSRVKRTMSLFIFLGREMTSMGINHYEGNVKSYCKQPGSGVRRWRGSCDRGGSFLHHFELSLASNKVYTRFPTIITDNTCHHNRQLAKTENWSRTTIGHPRKLTITAQPRKMHRQLGPNYECWYLIKYYRVYNIGTTKSENGWNTHPRRRFWNFGALWGALWGSEGVENLWGDRAQWDLSKN